MNKHCGISLLATPLLICLVTICHAQITTNFTRISIDQGLSNISIRSIIEDQQGMMWFCTEDGLNRFDSYQFKVFRHNRNDSNSIAQSKANSIIQDRDGIFWIATSDKGLSSYDDRFEVFTNYRADKENPQSLSGDRVNVVAEGPNGRILAGTMYSGISMFNKAKNSFKNYKMPNPIDNMILDIYVSKNRETWILTPLGLMKYDVPSDSFVRKMPLTKRVAEGNDRRLKISEDQEGNIWYGSLDGIWKYNPANDSHEHIDITKLNGQLKSPVIYQMLQTKDGNYYLASPNGIFTYLPKDQKAYLMVSPENNRDEIIYEEVNTIYEDKHGLLWAGTQYGGLLKINLTQPGFVYYGHKSKSPITLSKSVIRSLQIDNNGNYWVGNLEGALLKIDPSNQSTQPFVYDDPNSITCIYQDSNQDIWVGTWGSGLYKVGQSNRLEMLSVKFSETVNSSNKKVQSIREDGFGNLWIGTEMSLNLFNPESGENKLFLYNPKNYHGPYNSVQSNAIDIDQNGHIWVGTFEGLFRIIPKDQNKDLFESEFEVHQYTTELVDDRVTSLNYDKEFPNQLLAGTYSKGFNIIHFTEDNSEIKVENFNSSDGLCSDVVYGIQRDINNYIWVSTNHGLGRYDVQNNNFTNYYESDGLQGNQFFWGAFAKGSSEQLMFGGLNGFNVIDAQNIERDTSNAPVVFTGLRISNVPVTTGELVDGKTILPEDISYLKQITLNHDHDMFSLDFSSPHHVLPHQNQYAYRILGFKDDWIYTNGNDRTITLTNLDPGEYTVEVKASNYQGKWLQQPTQLTVIIDSPWWETWPFRTIMVVLLVILGYGIVKVRLKSAENAKSKLVEIVKEKTEEIMEKNDRLKDLNQELIDNLDEKLKVIEKLKLTQNQLIESEKMASIGVLTAGLAHELNNPLSYIGGIVDPIKMDLAELKPALSKEEFEKNKEIFDEIENLLEGMQFGVVKASEIIRNLLEISPKNKTDVNSVIDLNEMISATTKLINNAQKDIEISTSVSESLEVHGNKVELNQVLINIIQNACDAIPEDRPGKINVSGFAENGNVVVKIKDNGTGIDDKLANQIFEPFFTTKGPGKGTGLGLYISYSVIKKHNGKLVAKKNKEENGTTFTITVPRNVDTHNQPT